MLAGHLFTVKLRYSFKFILTFYHYQRNLPNNSFIASEPDLPLGQICIDPSLWQKSELLIKTEVYQGTLFTNCQQEIIGLAAGKVKVLRLRFGDPQLVKKVIVLGNGLNPSILGQAWSLIYGLAAAEPNIIIYLTELASQGLTHLNLDPQTGQLSAETYANLQNPFEVYEQDMHLICEFLQAEHPPQQSPELIALCLSTSCMPTLAACLDFPELFNKVIFNGPYLGLSKRERVLQFILHSISFLFNPDRKITTFADPRKKTAGLCSEPLAKRLAELDDFKTANKRAQALYRLQLKSVNDGGLCEIGSGLQNPPISWTNSANLFYDYLQKRFFTGIRIKSDLLFVRGSLDSLCAWGKFKTLADLSEAQIIELKGYQHNGFTNYPEKLIEFCL
jgi:hypothetical protein